MPRNSRPAEAGCSPTALAALIEFGRNSVSMLTPKRLAEYIVEHAAKLLDAPDAALMLRDPATGMLKVEATWGPRSDEAARAETAGGTALAEEVLGRGSPVVVTPKAADLPPSRDTRDHVRPAAAACVKTADMTLGALIVQRDAAFTRADVDLLQELADSAAVAIRNVALYTQVAEAYGDLERVQDQLAAFVGRTADAVLIVDPETRCLLGLNSHAEQLTQFKRQELLQMHDRDLRPQGESPGLPDAVDMACADGASFLHKARISAKCGPPALVDIDAVLVEHRGVRTVHAFVRATVHREELEARLRRTERMRLVGLLTSGLAHQLSGVLGGVLGIAQLLLREATDERSRRMLKMVEESATSGADTVKKVHEFARMEDDTGMGAVDIKEALDRAVCYLKAHPPSHARTDSMDVTVEHEDDRPLMVRGDVADLTDVFRYILENAFEACSPGGTVTIRTRRGDGTACMDIEDDGRGMSEDTLAKAFVPFFSTKDSAGSGLGLSIAYGMAHRHRGDITIESREIKGTTVHVSVPLHRLPERPRPPNVSTQSNRAKARVLAVDDERIILEVLCEMLRKAGHEVVSAVSGEDALLQLRRQEFDLVFTDYDMPAMSGERLAKEAKSIQPRTIVALLTGWGSTIDEDMVERSAVDFVLTKPFREVDIKEVVVSALRKRGASAAQAQ